MTKPTSDELLALAHRFYDDRDVYDDTAEELLFALLVDVAEATYLSYLDGDRPDLERPETFTPSTLGGVPQGWAMLEGLRENLAMNQPDGVFYVPGQPVGLESVMAPAPAAEDLVPTTGIDVRPKEDRGDWQVTSQTPLTDAVAAAITFQAEPAHVVLGGFVEVRDPDGVRIGRVSGARYSERAFGPAYVLVSIELR
jgi:catechol 2,3-dioxygenase-like lactoylglutathione lyase family enzyme